MRREDCTIGLRVRYTGATTHHTAVEGIICQIRASRVLVDWLDRTGASLQKPSWCGFHTLVAAPRHEVSHV